MGEHKKGSIVNAACRVSLLSSPGMEVNTKMVEVLRKFPIEPMNPPTFEQGVLWAAAFVAREYDQPTIAKEIIEQSGVDWKVADESDMPAIRKAMEE